MTTIVYAKGQLAADSRVSSTSGKVIDNRNIKLFKVKNITFDGIEVTWMGCSGNVNDSDCIRYIIQHGEGELKDVLEPFSRSIGAVTLKGLLLLSDARCVKMQFVRKEGGIMNLEILKPTKEFQAIGSGASTARQIKKLYQLNQANSIAFLASKYDSASGGQIYSAKASDVAIRPFKGLSKVTKQKVIKIFETMIAN